MGADSLASVVLSRFGTSDRWQEFAIKVRTGSMQKAEAIDALLRRRAELEAERPAEAGDAASEARAPAEPQKAASWRRPCPTVLLRRSTWSVIREMSGDTTTTVRPVCSAGSW